MRLGFASSDLVPWNKFLRKSLSLGPTVCVRLDFCPFHVWGAIEIASRVVVAIANTLSVSRRIVGQPAKVGVGFVPEVAKGFTIVFRVLHFG